jgi:hypothetical protein
MVAYYDELFRVVLLQIHFGSGMIFPDPYPVRDSAKSLRSDQIRIHNTDAWKCLQREEYLLLSAAPLKRVPFLKGV